MMEKIFTNKIGDLQEVKYVAGGSCVCFSKGDPERLTLQDLIDSLIPTLYASTHGLPVYLYFQSYETDLMSDVLVFDPKNADYLLMKEYLTNGVKRITQLLGHEIPEMHIIDTEEDATVSAIDEIAASVGKWHTDEQLFGLYGMEKGATYPKGCMEEALMLKVYRRNLALYKNAFFDLHPTLPNGEGRLTVENRTQERAISLVGVGSTESKTGALIYSPAPNCQGKEMNLGNRNHKLELRSKEAQISSRAKKMMSENPRAKKYYEEIFGDHPVEVIMQLWKEACQI